MLDPALTHLVFNGLVDEFVGFVAVLHHVIPSTEYSTKYATAPDGAVHPRLNPRGLQQMASRYGSGVKRPRFVTGAGVLVVVKDRDGVWELHGVDAKLQPATLTV